MTPWWRPHCVAWSCTASATCWPRPPCPVSRARAALETFYHALNTRSLDLVQRIWADDPLVQLGSPIAGVVRGTDSIVALYTRGFSVPARVQTVLEEIVAYAVPELVVFAGRERGSYSTHDTHDS